MLYITMNRKKMKRYVEYVRLKKILQITDIIVKHLLTKVWEFYIVLNIGLVNLILENILSFI